MGVTIIRGAEVTRPATTPLSSSVLDHAAVEEKNDFGLRNNKGLWPSYNCLDTLVPTALCPDPVAGYKEFANGVWIPGFEFAVYGGVQCSAVGLDEADMKAEIARVFDLNAGKGVEQALRLNRFVATTSGDPVQWDAPEDLGTAPSIGVALAKLEGYAATVYAGEPTLHLPRAAVLLASGLGLIVERDGKFFTKTGAKVAAGGGYDESAPDGVYDMYATGEVYVERSEQINVSAIVIPGDGSGLGSGENGLADNTVIGLAERMYRVAVDCFVAKVTGTVWS